jgi:hypothetical protein
MVGVVVGIRWSIGVRQNDQKETRHNWDTMFRVE